MQPKARQSTLDALFGLKAAPVVTANANLHTAAVVVDDNSLVDVDEDSKLAVTIVAEEPTALSAAPAPTTDKNAAGALEEVGQAAPKRQRSSSASPPRRGGSVGKTSSSTGGQKSGGGGGDSGCKWLPELITEPQWRQGLGAILDDPTWRHRCLQRIEQFIEAEERKGKAVLPPRRMIFTALNRTPLDEVKVVLLGQDPYHGIGQAHGLCFSVQPGVRPPPSLQNMYKELEQDIPGFKTPPHGYLQSWADQGILMLNATLTVNAHEANSHSKSGWQEFTDAVIAHLSRTHKKRLVFMLWGNFAKSKVKLIDRARHIVIESAHPSPLSARFWFGCRCFSKCNEALVSLGHTPINWHLPPHVSLAV